MSLTDLILDRAAARQTRSRTFPQLGGVTVYCAPWTCAERSQVIQAARDHGFTPKYEIDVLMLKARDADGKPLFGPHDRAKLLHQGDPDIIGQIADFLIGPEVFHDEAKEVSELGESSAPPGEPTSTTGLPSPTP